MAEETRSISTLRHKDSFAYECLCREALAVRWGVPMGLVVGRDICQNFGNIRDYCQTIRVVLELMGAFLFCSSAACHPVSILEDALPPPSCPSPRPAAGRWPDVLDVPLTAQWLTVSADRCMLSCSGGPAGTQGGPQVAHHENGGAEMAGAVRPARGEPGAPPASAAARPWPEPCQALPQCQRPTPPLAGGYPRSGAGPLLGPSSGRVRLLPWQPRIESR